MKLTYKDISRGNAHLSQRDAYGMAMSRAFKNTKNYGLITPMKKKKMSPQMMAAKKKKKLGKAAEKVMFNSKYSK
jgi:hypothetical protein